MKEFSEWLDSEPGMATRLKNKLSINATNISNWRNGHKPIPWTHMQTIHTLSKGKVPLKKMMEHRRQSASVKRMPVSK